MTGFDGAGLAAAVPWTAAAVLLVLAATFVVARLVGRHSVIDAAWGLLFLAVAVVAFVRSAGDGDLVRRWLLLALTVLWGLRLAAHIGRRAIGRPEDPRYQQLLARASGNRHLYALRKVYLLQGVLAYLISAPIQVGMFENGPVHALGWVGAVLACFGMVFEATADRQLESFRRARGGGVMGTGLWRYTRHPNYFGEACVWWGIFLVAAERWPGVLTVAAPALITLLVTRGSGARLLERHMRGRPGWDAYAARTSAFIPWPPRRDQR